MNEGLPQRWKGKTRIIVGIKNFLSEQASLGV